MCTWSSQIPLTLIEPQDSAEHTLRTAGLVRRDKKEMFGKTKGCFIKKTLKNKMRGIRPRGSSHQKKK